MLGTKASTLPAGWIRWQRHVQLVQSGCLLSLCCPHMADRINCNSPSWGRSWKSSGKVKLQKPKDDNGSSNCWNMIWFTHTCRDSSIFSHPKCAPQDSVVISRSTSVTLANFHRHQFQAALYGPNMSTFILASAPEHESDFTKQQLPAALSALNSRPRPSGDVSLLQREMRLRGSR